MRRRDGCSSPLFCLPVRGAGDRALGHRRSLPAVWKTGAFGGHRWGCEAVDRGWGCRQAAPPRRPRCGTDAWRERRAAEGPPRTAVGVSMAVSQSRPSRVGLLHLNCPRCGLTITPRMAWLTIEHCPRCMARAGRAVPLFCSPLPASQLYAAGAAPDGDPRCTDRAPVGGRDGVGERHFPGVEDGGLRVGVARADPLRR
jgi:hypothetical protein